MPELLFQKTNQKNKSEMECQAHETTSSFNEVHVLAICLSNIYKLTLKCILKAVYVNRARFAYNNDFTDALFLCKVKSARLNKTCSYEPSIKHTTIFIFT